MRRWHCIALFCFNYHLQYFELCVWVDNLLALSLTTSHACLCCLTLAARAMLQQRRRHKVCMHPDVKVSYTHIVSVYMWHECSGLVTSLTAWYHICDKSTPCVRLWTTVWGSHVSTINRSSLMLSQLGFIECAKSVTRNIIYVHKVSIQLHSYPLLVVGRKEEERRK